jgi:hypothetical protein
MVLLDNPNNYDGSYSQPSVPQQLLFSDNDDNAATFGVLPLPQYLTLPMKERMTPLTTMMMKPPLQFHLLKDITLQVWMKWHCMTLMTGSPLVTAWKLLQSNKTVNQHPPSHALQKTGMILNLFMLRTQT